MDDLVPRPDDTPRRGSDAFRCPRCGAFAHQEWFPLKREYYEETGESWTRDAYDTANPRMMAISAGIPVSPDHEDDEDNLWEMSQCGRCKEFSTWRGLDLIYPPASTLAAAPHPDMPTEAAALYLEARAVVAISRRAGAALARAALERVLKSLGGDAGSIVLAKRIERVLDLVSEPLAQMLTVIRHVGNKSLHVEDEPDEMMVLVLNPEEEEIVELIFESINELVDELITRPARKRAAFEKVPQHIRDQVAKK